MPNAVAKVEVGHMMTRSKYSIGSARRAGIIERELGDFNIVFGDNQVESR